LPIRPQFVFKPNLPYGLVDMFSDIERDYLFSAMSELVSFYRARKKP